MEAPQFKKSFVEEYIKRKIPYNEHRYSKDPSTAYPIRKDYDIQFPRDRNTVCPFKILYGKPRTNNAWVELIFGGSSYMPGIQVSCYSQKQVKTCYDIVCMVTNDVPTNVIQDIARICDIIIEIPLLSVPSQPMRTENQQTMYSSWNEYSYTKWNCLALTMYDKVCFIDCDKIILTNIDTIFTLKAPAATFGSAWAKTYAPYTLRDSNKAYNKRNGTNNNITTPYSNLPITNDTNYHIHSSSLLPLSKRVRYDVLRGFDTTVGGCNNPYWALQHGEKVHPGLIFLGLFRHSVSCTGTMVLLETCLKHYYYYIYMIYYDPIAVRKVYINNKIITQFGLPTCYSGKDEQSIALLYLLGGKQWYFIDARYNHIPWLPRWLQNTSLYMQPKIYHYFNTKPWIFAREQYKDLEVWWALARNLVRKYTAIEPPTVSSSNRTDSPDTFLYQVLAPVLIYDNNNTVNDKVLISDRTLINNKTVIDNKILVTDKTAIDNKIVVDTLSSTDDKDDKKVTDIVSLDTLPLGYYFHFCLTEPVDKFCCYCKSINMDDEDCKEHFLMDEDNIQRCERITLKKSIIDDISSDKRRRLFVYYPDFVQ